MSFLTTIALVFFALISNVSAAPTNITIFWNDLTRLTYSGLDIDARVFGDPQNAGKGCGFGYQATSTDGSNVSFNFTGTALQYTFLGDHSGSDAVITLNGTQVDTVPTFQQDMVAYANCSTITKSISVANGMHLVKISNSPVNANLTVMYFQSVTYTPSDYGAAPASNHSAVIGGVVASVIVLLLVIAAFIYTRRRKRQHVVDLLDLDSAPIEHELGGDNSPNHQEQFHDENSTSAIPFTIPNTPSRPLLTNHSSSNAPSLYSPSPFTNRPGSSTLPSSRHDNRTREKVEPPIQMGPIPCPSPETASGIDPTFIRELMQHNVPGPEIATLIRTMAAREGQSTDVGGLNSPDTTAPPAYDRN
ncbi:hypothetical protein FRB95_013348 [Tulasnella sp. JGI-2019a]|nr:hypothetical protein FRB95_013348 [Tulasnella sp. JGI-2019a]